MRFDRRKLAALKKEHPIFFWGSAAVLTLLVAATVVVAIRVPVYMSEAQSLDARMSEAERTTRDRILNSRARRSELAVALLRRELALRSLEEENVHLAVDTENSTLSLRHGPATLRAVPIEMGPDSTIQAPDGRSWRFIRGLGERHLQRKQASPTYTIPEWVYIGRGEPVPDESERRVEGGLGRYVLTLDDGTEIYSQPEAGPFVGSVKPGSFQVSEADLKAIYEAIRVETPVYIY